MLRKGPETMLEYMYITGDPAVAAIAEDAGVDEIFVDLEKRGKEQRQHGMNTVKSNHTVADAAAVRKALKRARLLVRINPVWEQTAREVDEAVAAGADILMLPYFKTVSEAETFLDCCAGRVGTRLLVETPQAAQRLDEILSLPGIGSIHIGLNDLHLEMKKKFMFELLTDGTVERICDIARSRGVPYGFGGVASLGKGALPAEYILGEHYRLGSCRAILSRSFCNVKEHTDPGEIREIFLRGMRELRDYEAFLSRQDEAFFASNREKTAYLVKKIAEGAE